MEFDHKPAAARLRQARSTAGYSSARAAARAFKWNTSTYPAHENGQIPLRPELAEIYGEAFKVSPKWLLYGEEEDSLFTMAKSSATLRIIGVAVDGLWKDESAPESWGASTMIADSRFPENAQFALKVAGTAMDKATPVPILDNAVVRCVSLEHGGVTLKNRAIVAVQLRKADLTSVVLRRAIFVEGRFEFRPESSDAKAKTILPGKNADGSEASAYAVVTGIFNAMDV